MSALDKLNAMPVLKVDDWEDGTVVHEIASPFPTERKPLTYGNEPESEREVSLAKLIGTQSRITREGVEKHLERDPKFFSIKVIETGDGRLYIGDGHHRATAAFLNGLKKIRASVVEAREGRERKNPADDGHTSFGDTGGIEAIFADLVRKASSVDPEAFPHPVALIVDEATALNGRDPHSRAHACAGIENGRGEVYIAPKLVTGFLDDGTSLFEAGHGGAKALRDRQVGVLSHELGHIALMFRGDHEHTERDADAEAERLFGKRINYDIEDVQTVGRGVHPRPKRLDVDGNPGRPEQHGCRMNPGVVYKTTPALKKKQEASLVTHFDGKTKGKHKVVATNTLIPVQDQIGPKHVQELATLLEAGYALPPIAITDDGEILDGHHRHEAAMQLGIRRVPVLVVSPIEPREVDE